MAERDFQINIRTLADLTGIKLTKEQLDALKAAAASGNTQAIEALKKLEAAQKGAIESSKRLAAEQREAERGIRNAAAYGLLIGGSIATAINQFANSQNRVTKELEEQGVLLVKNVQEWTKLAQSAGSVEQLAAAGEKATAQIDALRNKFNEANNEVLGITETIEDSFFKLFRGPLLDFNMKGPNEALLEERVRGLLLDLSTAQQRSAEIFKTRFDEIQAVGKGIDPVIRKITDDLDEARRVLSTLNPKDNLQSWVAQEQIVIRLTQRLSELNRQREAMVKAGQPTTVAGVLENQLERLRKFEKAPISTTDESKLRAAEIATEKKIRDAQIAEDTRLRSLDAGSMGRQRSFLPEQAPGQSQQDYNMQILQKLDELLRIWR